mmetsp:Transcript_113506/g.197145  ORF Transcript_113506/g.197145 Transcript_113506/m.197145 type:complete len:389 (-) Transcript_113506:13-1179(-)
MVPYQFAQSRSLLLASLLGLVLLGTGSPLLVQRALHLAQPGLGLGLLGLLLGQPLLGVGILLGTQNVQPLLDLSLDLGSRVETRTRLVGMDGGPGPALGTQNALHLLRIDDALAVGQTLNPLDAESRINLLEGFLGPNNHTSAVATRGKTEQIESTNVVHIDAGQVAERFHGFTALGDDNQRTLADGVPAVPPLALTSTDFLGSHHLLDVLVGSNVLQQLDGILGLLQSLSGRGNNERNLGNLLQVVATGHHQSGDSGSSQSSLYGLPLDLAVDLNVPLAEHLGRGEHTAPSAHVAEGTLSRAVGTTTGDTGNTGYSTAGTPRLSTGLVTYTATNSVGNASILSDVGVHELHDIISQSRREHLGQTGSLTLLLNCYQGSSCHFNSWAI